jgi:hypothetical protein
MTKMIVLMSVIFAALSAQAYKYQESNKSISPTNLLREAQRLGLGTPGQELNSKRDIRAWKATTVRKHLDYVVPDALLLEIKAGQNNMERAKTLARLELFRGAQKNWNKIKNTALNDTGAENWFEFEDKLRRDLERIEFSETADTKNFLFITPWGHARVSKDLKKVSWAIEVGRHLDGNKLEEGVEDIVIPNHPRQSPTVPAPTL